MKILGVSCASERANLAVVVGTEVVLLGPQRLDVVHMSDSRGALLATIRQWDEAIVEVHPDAVALLLPESDRNTKHPHSYWRARIQMETMLAVACEQRSIPLHDLPRATVKTELGLELRGKLELAEVALEPVGKYWMDGRKLASLAALALEHQLEQACPVPSAAREAE